MTLSRYDSLEGINAEWLGKIPSHWGVIRLRYLFKRIKRTNYLDKELLSVYRDFGVVPKNSRDDNHNKPSDDLTPYQLVMPGDLVMNKMKAWQGSIAISEYEGIVSPAYFVYSFSDEGKRFINPKYAHYLLRSPAYISQYMARSKGIRVNQWDLEPEAFEHIEVLLPSFEEQDAIATFLDRETQRIDSLIEEKQTFIQLLKEKRQALINHIVTKGLNPNVEMHNSGIEWIGQVPKHWEKCRVKQSASFMTSGPRGWSDFIIDNGHAIFLQSGDLNNELGLNLAKAKKVSPPDGAEGQRTQLQMDDVVVCITGANTGRVALVTELDSTVYINQHLSLIRPVVEKVSSKYLAYFLSSEAGSRYYALEQYGLKEGLSLKNVAETPLILPPLSEQTTIEKYLDKALAKLSNLVTSVEESISLLKERRTSLISAAVTGKIDVRETI